MTLSELDDSLPNGFHDAYLMVMNFDFRTGSGALTMRILVSEIDEANRYEDIEVLLDGVEAVIVEGPEDLVKSYRGPLGICSFETTEKQLPRLASLPEDVRRRYHSFFAEPWNSFIHISARDARVLWPSRPPSTNT